ncbi:hypothetical protein [Dyadobacter arcticus]|uniref:Uncharacterized protein n=1 Tax=Dyadobacter arcticus TaxID=1078754 RepID=A0ABX0ULU7_9BACT|nr:hypothetical protein [Dyadobacter arcticus]NIJ52944.1 hypothetical protein [Dyadobacter arcticus]
MTPLFKKLNYKEHKQIVAINAPESFADELSAMKTKCDFNRDTGFAAVGKYGFEPVRQVAIDDDWSSLKFKKSNSSKQLLEKKATH